MAANPMDGPGARALQLDSSDFHDTVREALALGASLWIRATGSSNEPTIPVNAMVRVNPRTGPVRIGDMVLVLGRDRRPLLHRVRWVSGRRVVTIGDARLDDVAGAVDVISVDGETRPVSRGYITALRLELLRLKRRIAIAVWRLLHRRDSRS